MQLPNILIVDDSREMLSYMEIVLKPLKANILSANTGQKALDLIKNQELALAILDVQMPEMNGYTLALKINESRIGAIVPIIFLTAVYQDQVEIVRGYESGAVDYIFKPINRTILLGKINVFLELYNQKKNRPEDLSLLKEFEENLSRSNAELLDSEEKFRSFLENAPDGVFIMNKKGNYLEMNEAVCTITGYQREEMLAMNLHDLSSQTGKGKWDTFFKKLLVSGTANDELFYSQKNGLYRWCSLHGVKLMEDQYLCFIKDITQTKTAAEALIKSEEKYRTLLNASPEGIIIVNTNGIITDISEIGVELYGADQPSELLGKHILRFAPPGFKKKFREI